MREDLKKLLINHEFFEELTDIQYDEIKYGISPEDAKKMTSDEIQKIQKTSNFESALNEIRLERNKKLSFGKNVSSLSFNLLFAVVFLSLVFQFLLWITDFIFRTHLASSKIPIFNIPLYYVAIPLGFWMGYSMAQSSNEEFRESRKRKAERLESLTRLRKLFIECENYNKIIKSINVKDTISNVLHQETDEAREEILFVLEKIRGNIIKALKIDKVFRENSDVIKTTRESLEITFAELQYTDIKSHASQYSEFVDEVLNLGMSLNREFETLNDIPS